MPDRELACAPIRSSAGQEYIGAMNSAINVALANRQMLALIVREIFGRIFPGIELRTLYDVSHNTCKEEFHRVGRNIRSLWVHRKRERPARWDPAMRHFRKPTRRSNRWQR